MDIEYFKKVGMDSQEKKETLTQENFSSNYDESKVIDIKAMGLVKKRKRDDLEKDPLTLSSSNGNCTNGKDKDIVNDKITK